jgi:O-antigen/teichoic acid export membrane protein
MRWKACLAIWDRDFLLYAGATFSVLLALFLFSSADRIVAQSWFGVAIDNNLGLVNWALFDAYQTAGLLGRGILWGTQPLLWILFAQRSRLDRTTPGSLTFFWIYLGALLPGAILLGCLAQPLSRLFCGPHFQSTALFVPSFAAVMVPLGLLQALGVFSLASRRYHECFVLGGCGVAYTLVLLFFGRRPELMPPYMFGGGLVSLMVVLFVGIVRWGRKQP